MTSSSIEYRYSDTLPGHHHEYLMPTVMELLRSRNAKRIFDLGCGNGSLDAALRFIGIDVEGVDPSPEAVEMAQKANPGCRFELGAAGDPLAERFGRYETVISLEVVEHVFLPRLFAKSLYDLVDHGGVAIVSTPYHGYWKNLALAVSGKMDAHFTALWDYGHIKFWSEKTLRQLLQEAGFKRVDFIRGAHSAAGEIHDRRRLPRLSDQSFADSRSGNRAIPAATRRASSFVSLSVLEADCIALSSQ